MRQIEGHILRHDFLDFFHYFVHRGFLRHFISLLRSEGSCQLMVAYRQAIFNFSGMPCENPAAM